MERWTEILQHTPIRSLPDKVFILNNMRGILDGFVATTDVPAMLFVPELIEMFPDARVICTVGDPDDWANSIDTTSQQSLAWYLRLLLFPLSSMRNFPHYLDVLQAGRWGALYQSKGEPQVHGRLIWDRHLEHLKKNVPADRLTFFDPKDGWKPLCEALNCDVPDDIPFPYVNDGTAIDDFTRELFVKGITRWACLVGILAAYLALWLRF